MQVRSQDAVFGLAVSREGRDTAWTWLKVVLKPTSFVKPQKPLGVKALMFILRSDNSVLIRIILKN